MVFSLLFGLSLFFFFKQKTAYEMRISDWSSDVCSSDLLPDQDRAGVDVRTRVDVAAHRLDVAEHRLEVAGDGDAVDGVRDRPVLDPEPGRAARVVTGDVVHPLPHQLGNQQAARSEEHTSELQSLMRISYAVFCLKNKKKTHTNVKT